MLWPLQMKLFYRTCPPFVRTTNTGIFPCSMPCSAYLLHHNLEYSQDLCTYMCPSSIVFLPLPHPVQFSQFLCSKILNWNCEWFKMSKVAHSKTKQATIGRHWYIKLLAVLYSITIKQGSIGTKTKPSLCATYTR